jgi:aspartyl-tRNA(Asn)/glutamyl-tRNA(Gln) amidotransferase subunit A
MQIVGRPFADATILRVAHAYEQATRWRSRRPRLDPAARFSTALPPVPDPEPVDVDSATRDRAASAARAAGLNLSDRQFAMLCAAAPYVEAMTQRLYRERHWAEEPANIFLFGG